MVREKEKRDAPRRRRVERRKAWSRPVGGELQGHGGHVPADVILLHSARCSAMLPSAPAVAPPRLLPGGAVCRVYLAACMCYDNNCFWRCRPRMEKIGGLGRVICAWQMLHRFAFAKP